MNWLAVSTPSSGAPLVSRDIFELFPEQIAHFCAAALLKPPWEVCMAGFCGSCGFPQRVSATFCSNCGARVRAANAAPEPAMRQAPPPPMPAPAAVRGSGKGMKIALAVVGCMIVMVAAAIGGLWYIGHRVKQAVVEKAQAYGVTLPDVSPAGGSSERARLPRPCEILSSSDVSGMIGEPIVRTEEKESGCMYFGPPGLYQSLAKDQMSSTFQRAEAPGASVPAGDVATAADQLANSIAAGTDRFGTGGDMPLVMTVVGPDGKAQMTAMTATSALFGGIANASGASGAVAGAGQNVPGLGDRALRMPKMGLNVLQGDTIVRVIVGPVPNSTEKDVEIARAILQKL